MLGWCGIRCFTITDGRSIFTPEQAITPRTRGVIVVHPNNPTGHFVKNAEIAK